MKDPLYYLRIWIKLFLMSLKRSGYYKTEIASRIIRAVTIIVLQIILAQSLFSMSESIAGWTQAQFYLLIGTFNLVMYVSWGFFSVNLFRLNEKLSKGEIDYSLTKPTGNYFELVFGEFFIDDMIPGLGGIVIIFLYLVTQPVSAVGILLYLVAVVIGIIIWLSISTIFATVGFFNFKLRSLDILPSLGQLGNVPGGAWGSLEIVTKTVFPIGFITVFPAEILIWGLDLRKLTWGISVMVIFYLFSRILWATAIRNYESGG